MSYSFKKEKLSPDQIQKYGLDPQLCLYRYVFETIIEERSYDIENEYLDKGHIIHFQDLIQKATNIFDYVLVVSKK